MKTITYENYFDKVYGCWFGKCLGGAAGAPLEGTKNPGTIIDFRTIINPSLPNDDLDLQLLWLEVLQQYGDSIDSKILAEAWLKKCWYPFSEYGYFLKNYMRGIDPPVSGWFNNSFFKEGMGCPIRSEIWALVYPLQPDKAVEYAKLDATLDHSENSLYAEQFLAAIASMAFVESDVDKLIQIGLKYVPESSRLYSCINDVIKCWVTGENYEQARSMIYRKYSHPDFTNSIQNLGYIVISLLFGEADLEKTIQIALNCGYDTDCIAASAAAIIGQTIGYKNISVELKEQLNDKFVIGIDIDRTDNSIKTLAEDTCQLGISLLKNKNLISNICESIECLSWNVKKQDILIDIIYNNMPAIGLNDTCNINLIVTNNTNSLLAGELKFVTIPKGFEIEINSAYIEIPAQQQKSLSCKISYINTDVIEQTNIFEVAFEIVDNIIQTKMFGIAGAWPFNVFGPFYEQLHKSINPNHPSCHSEGCFLPTLEEMVNNEVFLDYPYYCENDLINGVFNNKSFAGLINCYEDLITIDNAIEMEGQMCIYLASNIYSDEEMQAWLVIGNNDGFKIWLNGNEIISKDEIRLWTPYNNCEQIILKKGINRIVIKLLRRTKSLDFSVGIRHNKEGVYYHACKWVTNLKFGI